MEEFIACFSEVSDPRQDNVLHKLYEVLIIALCCLPCGGEDCSNMEAFGRAKRPFLRQFLRLKHGIPSYDTFSRVFRQLDPKPFQACFVRFMERFAQGLEGVIAVDAHAMPAADRQCYLPRMLRPPGDCRQQQRLGGCQIASKADPLFASKSDPFGGAGLAAPGRG